MIHSKLTQQVHLKTIFLKPLFYFIQVHHIHEKYSEMDTIKDSNSFNPTVDSNRFVSECSRRRPDMLWMLPGHAVIVEVDEKQHSQITPECECARICEITGSLGGLPFTIIRYNPDEIKNQGFPVEIGTQERLAKLEEVTKKELATVPGKFEVKLIQLYYNDDYLEYLPYKEEDITSIVAV